MNDYEFGNYLYALRKKAGLSQTEMALRLDVTNKAVSKWENGQAIPRMETFEKLAETLGTTIEDILSAPTRITFLCLPDAINEAAVSIPNKKLQQAA